MKALKEALAEHCVQPKKKEELEEKEEEKKEGEEKENEKEETV